MARTKSTRSSPLVDEHQHARFVEIARALGCDEDAAAFDEKMKAMAGPRQPTQEMELRSRND